MIIRLPPPTRQYVVGVVQLFAWDSMTKLSRLSDLSAAVYVVVNFEFLNTSCHYRSPEVAKRPLSTASESSSIQRSPADRWTPQCNFPCGVATIQRLSSHMTSPRGPRGEYKVFRTTSPSTKKRAAFTPHSIQYSCQSVLSKSRIVSATCIDC